MSDNSLIEKDGVIKEYQSVVNAVDTPSGILFAEEVERNIISDFEKDGDLMAHVSTFLIYDGIIYVTYYANIHNDHEDPNYQTARFVCCPAHDTRLKKYYDIQTVGEKCLSGTVEQVYDTIMVQKNSKTIVILWTAKISGEYYRLYRDFDIETKSLGNIYPNILKIRDDTAELTQASIKRLFHKHNLPCKNIYADIGIMQKITSHCDNGTKYYYTGMYSGALNCIIRSSDFYTWEYVAQPDFQNYSAYENACHIFGDKCFYFVRQHESQPYGFLTVYDLKSPKWETPVLIEDCQSRGDFILYNNNLYLFHAPTDREHIGIMKIDTDNIANSSIVLQARMKTSFFYPFVREYNDYIYISYTVGRKHIRLSKFDFKKYLK